jgi:hypothetical protein
VEEELILTVGKREAEVSVAARCSKGGIREIRKKKELDTCPWVDPTFQR